MFILSFLFTVSTHFECFIMGEKSPPGGAFFHLFRSLSKSKSNSVLRWPRFYNAELVNLFKFENIEEIILLQHLTQIIKRLDRVIAPPLKDTLSCIAVSMKMNKKKSPILRSVGIRGFIWVSQDINYIIQLWNWF